MTRERALQIIEGTKTNHAQSQGILLGLQILAKYDEELDCSFEHDQMWVSDFEATVKRMSKDEVIGMARLGWFEADDRWSHW